MKREGNKKNQELRHRRGLTSILTVAKATLPLELRQSRFWRRKNETRTRVWKKSHHAEGNGAEKEENENRIRKWRGEQKDRCGGNERWREVLMNPEWKSEELSTTSASFGTVRCDVPGFHKCSPTFNNRLRGHLTDLISHGSPFQQQSEAVGCLLVVFKALTQPTIIILHQPPVHYRFKLTWRRGDTKGPSAWKQIHVLNF